MTAIVINPTMATKEAPRGAIPDAILSAVASSLEELASALLLLLPLPLPPTEAVSLAATLGARVDAEPTAVVAALGV